MRRSLLGIVALSGLAAASIAWTSSEPPRAGRLIVVKLVDVSATEYKFEPALITASKGDTVRFEQTSSMLHNVAFRTVPEAAKIGDAMEGPYMTSPGEKYDLVIDARFVNGEYQVVCTPHEMMGMKAALTIATKK